MALVNRSFSVNVTPGMMPPIVHVSEYDVGRAYTVSILDEQGNTFTIPSGTTASIEGTLNGSVGFTQSATVSNNQVSFTLSQSMTAYSGKAWCKIKLTQNSQPIQTCAFVLAVDRAGVEADTILGGSGFQEQINEGIAEYFDNDPPFFELPSGGQSGQALLSDGENGAYWGEAQGGGGSGLTEDVKQTLLACFRNVAWATSDGQSFYDALYNALYQQANLSYITAVFVQGQAVIYTDDSLDTLKQYLTVTAHYDDGQSVVLQDSDYTLSGTLVVGTSTIRVIYSGKTTTFTCAATRQVLPTGYTRIDYINVVNTSSAPVYIATGVVPSVNLSASYKLSVNSVNAAGHFASGSQYYLPFFRSEKLFANRLGNEYDQSFVGLRADTPYTIDAFMTENKIDVNSENVTTLSAGSRSSSAITLFTYDGQTNQAYLFSGRFYYMKLYQSGTLIHDYIPCKNSNNVVGIWDSVAEEFLTSATANPLYEP